MFVNMYIKLSPFIHGEINAYINKFMKIVSTVISSMYQRDLQRGH